MFVYYIQLITFYYYRIIILLYIIIIILYLKQNKRPSIGGNLCMTLSPIHARIHAFMCRIPSCKLPIISLGWCSKFTRCQVHVVCSSVCSEPCCLFYLSKGCSVFGAFWILTLHMVVNKDSCCWTLTSSIREDSASKIS